MVTYMLPVAELLSVGREPLERSIWANLTKTASSVTELNIHSLNLQPQERRTGVWKHLPVWEMFVWCMIRKTMLVENGKRELNLIKSHLFSIQI